MVLMSTYNGEKYIETQIESILNQKNVDVKLFVRDDGSNDTTIQILERYQKEGKLCWYTGPNLKPAKSFMNLVQNSTDADYYAFSDQDDYWMPDKLAIAIEKLKPHNDVPALYYGKPLLVDQDLNEMKQSSRMVISTTMKQASIYSNATGCTMCFNRKMRDMINIYTAEFQIMHDNWIHKLCVSIGGYLFYDKQPTIMYRQHSNNVIGSRSTIFSRTKRHIRSVLYNRCYRSNSIKELYNGYHMYMTNENAEICKLISQYKKGINRFRIIFDKEFKTNNIRLNCIFRIAVLFGIF